MPRKREDSEEEERFLDDSDDGCADEAKCESTSGTLVENKEERSTSKASLRAREASRSIEWSFFENMGPWSSTNANYRKAKCRRCSFIVRSKRATMQNHITSCKKIEKTPRDMYRKNKFSFGVNSLSAPESDSASIKQFFMPKVSKKRSEQIES